MSADRSGRSLNHAAARWFDVWLRVFVAGILGPLLQITVIGSGTLVAALIGALVCAIGLANYDPRRWREVQGHVTNIGDSLHSAAEAIGEPRTVAHARMRRTY